VPDYSYVDPLSFDADYDYSYDGIMRSVEFSYARLGLNRIDILYVHDIGVYTHGAAKNAVYQKQLLDSGVKALEELKSSGAISAFGLGVNEVPVCLDVMRHADLDCILLAGRYTLLDRSAVAELLPLCRQKGTSLVIGGVFNSGILATGPVPGSHFDYMPASEDVLAKVGAMEAIAKRHGAPLAAAAMQFPLRDPIVASVLIGTAKPSSLTRNMETVEPPLPDSIYGEFEPYTLVAPPLGAEAVRV
jgi:D-threo-aldose 1-dehydrogenase